ncbi:hypothetical protein SeMB42_g04302 [Synchytrium endobioticum]|uniref:Uncharacterized protein n=1 Tax=Synchytrium endobioticum TaxID=286115 RepID=A0A507CZA6_9FUNG|nr:hypothetical protein SeMB42_g04302 [Synchytrium endobioticum]
MRPAVSRHARERVGTCGYVCSCSGTSYKNTSSWHIALNFQKPEKIEYRSPAGRLDPLELLRHTTLLLIPPSTPDCLCFTAY